MNRWAAIARFGGWGDNLIAASPLAALKRMGYMTEVITSPPAHSVFLHNPYIDKLSVKIVERDMPQDSTMWQAWIESRAKEYDVFGHFSHSLEGRHSVFSHMTAFWWPEEYRRKVCSGSYIETVHDIVGAPYEFGPLYFASDEEKQFAQTVKDKVGPKALGWVLCGTRIDKLYPYGPAVISRIIKELNIPVILFGGTSDRETSSAEAIKSFVEVQNSTRDGLFRALPDPTNMAKNWPMRTSLALMQACDVLVTPDTGPAWAVAFEPTAKIMLLSHGSAENVTKHWINTTTLHADPNRVPCWPCHRLHNSPETCVVNKEKNGAACISDISVERLVETVRRVWADGNVIHAEGKFSLADRAKRPQREAASG